jgi:hypothetical protein
MLDSTAITRTFICTLGMSGLTGTEKIRFGSTAAKSADGIRYVREINVGKNIGLDKFNNMKPTSIMTVLTDEFGNLITATPGVIK